MQLLREIGREASERLLLLGSPPPDGRDIDLLVRPAEQQAIARWLSSQSFTLRRDRWVRFGDSAVAVVELIPLESLHLPPAEARALFDESVPMPGMCNIGRPSPAHALLILARRVRWSSDALTPSRRRRIDEALAVDADAWLHAQERAPRWHLEASLGCLRIAYEHGQAASRTTRGRAFLEAAKWARRESHTATARAYLKHVIPLERGAVISLSGLDGAGKSSQAVHLAETLRMLGYRTVILWSPIGSNRFVPTVASLGKRLLSAFQPQERALPGSGHQAGGFSRVPRGPASAITAAWVIFMGLANAVAQARPAGHLVLGRVVICDRYALDSAVHLLHRYGDTRAVRMQIALISLLSPRPLRAYLLEVEPDLARNRKRDRWTTDQLRQRFALYQELSASFGAFPLNADRPEGLIAVELARDVWQHLP